MSAAMLTGSRVYGTAKKTSDIDLVVLVTPAEARELAATADRVDGGGVKPGSAAGQGALEYSLKFGRLNLLVCTDPVQYVVWQRGTERLKRAAPVTRELAVAMFEALRTHYQINEDEPDLADARAAMPKEAETDQF